MGWDVLGSESLQSQGIGPPLHLRRGGAAERREPRHGHATLQLSEDGEVLIVRRGSGSGGGVATGVADAAVRSQDEEPGRSCDTCAAGDGLGIRRDNPVASGPQLLTRGVPPDFTHPPDRFRDVSLRPAPEKVFGCREGASTACGEDMDHPRRLGRRPDLEQRGGSEPWEWQEMSGHEIGDRQRDCRRPEHENQAGAQAGWSKRAHSQRRRRGACSGPHPRRPQIQSADSEMG